ncbi:MAG: fibronectin type III domain-containing protein [Acidobacteria bacterium]|nr:fibronectin type III domain-containing protein [Acidobacteriota bacterium]
MSTVRSTIPRWHGALVAALVWVATIALPTITWGQERTLCTPEPTDMVVTYGDVIDCSIESSGDSDTFRFSGSAGEVIVIQGVIGAVSSVRPCVELVGPNGSRLQACANAFVNRIDTTLAVTGTYTILVRDEAARFTGQYTLVLERLIPPTSRASSISYGQTLQDRIGIVGDLDVFYFTGTANDLASVGVANVSPSSVRPCVELIAPGNTREIACNNAFNNRIQTRLTRSGVFAVLVRDEANRFTGGYALDVQCLAGPCVLGPTPPAPPTNLTVSVDRSNVTLNWTAPTTGSVPTSYVIEAGSAAGATDLALFDTGNAGTSFGAARVAPGTYFLRVRARNAGGMSEPSNEVVSIVVGDPGPCNGPPGLPGRVTYSNNGSLVTLSWNAATGGPTTYVIEAGSSSGLSDLVNSETGSTSTALTVAAPPGTYFVRVRARNTCGTSGPSNEIIVAVQ